MRRQQSTKPSNVWFFQKISRSNLCLTDPWQLQISLLLSLLALHLVEKLSDSHLCQAAQVFIMCIHWTSHIVHISNSLRSPNKHPGNHNKNIYATVIYVFSFSPSPHIYCILIFTIIFLSKLQLSIYCCEIWFVFIVCPEPRSHESPSASQEICFLRTEDEPELCPLAQRLLSADTSSEKKQGLDFPHSFSFPFFFR